MRRSMYRGAGEDVDVHSIATSHTSLADMGVDVSTSGVVCKCDHCPSSLSFIHCMIAFFDSLYSSFLYRIRCTGNGCKH